MQERQGKCRERVYQMSASLFEQGDIPWGARSKMQTMIGGSQGRAMWLHLGGEPPTLMRVDPSREGEQIQSGSWNGTLLTAGMREGGMPFAESIERR